MKFIDCNLNQQHFLMQTDTYKRRDKFALSHFKLFKNNLFFVNKNVPKLTYPQQTLVKGYPYGIVG